MYRPRAHIQQSAERIGWIEAWEAGEHSDTAAEMAALGILPKRRLPSWHLRHLLWERYQAEHILYDLGKPLPFTLPYESLRGHALYIPPDRRAHFAPRQTE